MTDVLNDSTVKRPPASSFSVEESPRVMANKMVSAKSAICCCFISALCITLHNGIRFGELAVMRSSRTHASSGGPRHNMTEWEMMEPNGVYEHWKERHSVRGLHVLDEMAGVIGYSAVIPIISFITPVLSRNVPGSLVYIAIPAMAFASGIRVMEWTYNMGIRTGSDWMSTWKIMVPNDARTAAGDVQFIQVLEMIYRMQRFKESFLYTADYFFIGIAMWVLSRSAITTNTFSKRHAYLGYTICVLSFLHFVSDILRLVTWGVFMFPSILTRLLVGVIMLPIWLTWLGCLLKSTPTSELSTLLHGSGSNYQGM